MEFGEKFIRMYRAIYSKQEAKVVINGETTKNFQIQKGTRQGCPLSALLFILSLETLNRVIREDDQISGLKIRNENFKVQAFADDLVFIIEEPMQSGIQLMEVLEEYGEVAGLNINKDKMKMLVKSMTEAGEKELERKIDIQIVKKN